MTQKIDIEGLHCLCSATGSVRRIAYVLYPTEIPAERVERMVAKYGVGIVVVTGMDWQNVFSPWAAPGVPAGDPDFKGEAPGFLKLMQQSVLPQIENVLAPDSNVERTLVGVSMSGLFALWQWMVCPTFANIASLSGSFWYDGFDRWMKDREIPPKTGKAYFLLGRKESKSAVKAFDSVGENTAMIVDLLTAAGINVEYQLVPGNHFSDPIPRLESAFAALFS